MKRQRCRHLLSYSVLAALVLFPLPVAPATIGVNDTCTLVDAINAANNDDDQEGRCPPGGSGADVLRLNGDVSLYAVNVNYRGDTGLPVVTTDITVDGAGFAIERAPAAPPFRIFAVASSGTLVLNDVVVANADGAGNRGAGIYNRGGDLTLIDTMVAGNHGAISGGGIFSAEGNLSVTRSSLSDNTADYAGGLFTYRDTAVTITDSTVSGNSAMDTAAILAVSPLSVTASTLSNNRAERDTGGISSYYYPLTVTLSTISDNASSRRGGGIFAYGSAVTVTNSTLSNNAGGDGGGIHASVSAVAVMASTISSNVAGEDGGGIHLFSSNATVTNSTLSGNTADRGGGIHSARSTTYVTNSTVSGNAASTAGGGIYHSSAGSYGPGLTLANSIVGNSPAGGNCAGDDIVDGGNNFDDDGSCPGAATIIPGTDFDTTLADNGGPTLTHALFVESVARDAAGDCDLATDQRGMPRDDGACDSGSFELADGACCTDGPGIESDCIITAQTDCEADGGRFLGGGSECGPEVDCSALLVTMQSMSAEVAHEGVLVGWTTAIEVDTVGFLVLRQTGGRREKALQQVGSMVPALGSEVDGGSYVVLDDSPEAARAVHYYIEDIDLFGKVTRNGPVRVDRGIPQGRATRFAPR